MKSVKHDAQVIIEFTFSFVILLLLFYGCVMAFRWAGLSMSDREIAHEDTMVGGISETSEIFDQGPLKQLKKDFAPPTPMGLVFNKW